MPVPDYQSVMLPLLSAVADGIEYKSREVINQLASHFALTDSERTELLPSGNNVFETRVMWARTYLKKAGLLQNTRWGYFQITERGKDALAKQPLTIDLNFLRKYPEFVEYYTGKKPEDDSVEVQLDNTDAPEKETPEELLYSGYQRLRQRLESDLLSRVKSAPPEFFEWLVVKLLIAMGYGGSLADAGRAIGKSGDGGIDGVIKEDRLGLDVLYIQANVGIVLRSGARKSNSSSVLWKERGREEEYLLRHLRLRRMQEPMQIVWSRR